LANKQQEEEEAPAKQTDEGRKAISDVGNESWLSVCVFVYLMDGKW
jgi:hypothetical protein